MTLGIGAGRGDTRVIRSVFDDLLTDADLIFFIFMASTAGLKVIPLSINWVAVLGGLGGDETTSRWIAAPASRNEEDDMALNGVLLPSQPTTDLPDVRVIQVSDLRDVLHKGLDDFWAMPTHVVFLCAIYPIAGLTLFYSVFAYDVFPLLYPLASGFALVGPFAAIGLYELSRRRELGLDTSWAHAFDVIHSPSLMPIIAVGALLLSILGIWIAVAHTIYVAIFGDRPLIPLAFVQALLTTREGLTLIVIGNAVGFVFALLAACVSVISLPLLLDRNVGFSAAVLTSVRVVAANPVTMSIWFALVAGMLLLGSVPMLVGLAIVLPILGHSTWHLYRIAVEPDQGERPEYHPKRKGIRYAADFPASLFARSERPDDEAR